MLETISAESKMRTPDRVFKLEPMEGKSIKASSGVIDPRLFKDGEDGNRLHCIMDLHNSLWAFKYDKGAIPPALQGMFTGIRQAKDHAERYFANRNVKITEVIDNK